MYDSNVMRRALVVCPATVLSHWITELHEWAPQLRVVILHRCAYAFNDVSGSSGEKTQVTLPDSCVHIVLYCIVCCRKTFKLKNCAQDPYARRTAALQSVTYLLLTGKVRTFVQQICGWSNIVVVISYEGLKSLKTSLLPCDWDYGILDEGQRIRNPDAEVTELTHFQYPKFFNVSIPQITPW